MQAQVMCSQPGHMFSYMYVPTVNVCGFDTDVWKKEANAIIISFLLFFLLNLQEYPANTVQSPYD